MSYARNLARLARTGAPTVDTAQALRDMPIYGGLYPKRVETLGALTAGDGGGGPWRWDPDSTADDNLATVLLPTGHVGTGRYIAAPTVELSVRRFGAGTGRTADANAAAFAAAITELEAMGGGVLLVDPAPDQYQLAPDVVSLGSAARIVVEGRGARILGVGSGAGITVRSGAGTPPIHEIRALRFDAQTLGVGTAVRVEDSQDARFVDLQILGFDKAFDMALVSLFAELHHFSGCLLRNNNYGWYYHNEGSPNRSFATQRFESCSAVTTNSAANTAYGVYIGENVSLYRSTFDGLVIFPMRANDVCIYCDGTLRHATGSLSFESQYTGAEPGPVGLWYGPNANLIDPILSIDIRGQFAAAVRNDSAEAFAPIRSNNKVPGGLIVDSDKDTDFRTVINDDLDTVRWAERAHLDGSMRFLGRSEYPPQFLDYLAPTQLLPLYGLFSLGRGALPYIDVSGATPSVSGANAVRLTDATATTLTDFADGVSGQILVVLASNSNTTIDHAPNIALAGSANWTMSNGDILVLWRVGSLWRELSRSAA